MNDGSLEGIYFHVCHVVVLARQKSWISLNAYLSMHMFMGQNNQKASKKQPQKLLW